MSCSPAVMYSVCKPDISETSKSEPVYDLLAIKSSEHTRQRISKKLAHCGVLFVAVRMFARHTLDVQPSVLPNCECSSQTTSTSDGFQAIFSCPLPCCGIIFLYLKWPAYTWTTQQRKHPANLSLCILLACWEQKTQHFHSCMIFGFERGVNEMCASLGGFYAASIDSFLPTFRDNSGVGEDSSHLGRFALSTGQFTCIFGANSPRCHVFYSFLPS